MKQLINKPFFLAVILTFPLWIVFSNFLVAAMVALFFAFLLSMCHALYVLRKPRKPRQK